MLALILTNIGSFVSDSMGIDLIVFDVEPYSMDHVTNQNVSNYL
jgi:hypothetical protein